MISPAAHLLAAQIRSEMLSMDDVRFLNGVLNETLQTTVIRQFGPYKPGDQVKFTVNKGVIRDIVGTVLSVNRKTVTVQEPGRGRWRVSPSLLSKVAPVVDVAGSAI